MDDPKDEKIFELQQEVAYLRKQITYLQEELSSVEDDMVIQVRILEEENARLEEQLGKAWFGK